MKETSATGVKGFLLPDAGVSDWVFRVYHDERDERGHRKFTDYNITHTDLEIQIIDKNASFVEDDKGRKTLDNDFASLGKAPRTDKPTKEQLRRHGRSMESTVLAHYDKQGKRHEAKVKEFLSPKALQSVREGKSAAFAKAFKAASNSLRSTGGKAKAKRQGKRK